VDDSTPIADSDHDMDKDAHAYLVKLAQSMPRIVT